MCDILLVEDNSVFRRTLYESLIGRYPQADIEAVESGEAALQMAAETPPKMVLLDIALPGISGLEVTEQLRRRPGAPTVVIVTGNDYPEYWEVARDKGADFFVSKNTAKLEEILSLAGILIGVEDPEDDLTEKFFLAPTAD